MTSDKDILRSINRMPTSEFLIRDKDAKDDDVSFADDDEMVFDDWVMLDST